jgi:hypothetical protein
MKDSVKYHSGLETVSLTIWPTFPLKLSLTRICLILLKFKKVLDKYRLEKERGQMLDSNKKDLAPFIGCLVLLTSLLN